MRLVFRDDFFRGDDDALAFEEVSSPDANSRKVASSSRFFHAGRLWTLSSNSFSLRSGEAPDCL